jgi:hypothetical protein
MVREHRTAVKFVAGCDYLSMNRVVVLLVVVLTTSCHTTLARRGAATPSPAAPETASVGQGLVSKVGGGTPVPQSAVGALKGLPLFVLTLRDQNGDRAEGIAVRFEGPAKTTVLTDAKGEAKIFDPPGEYKMRVDKGCYPALQVVGGVYGTVHLYTGQARRASLSVTWRHRYVPSAPATTDAGGDWPVGRAVQIRFGVQDRCNEALAPRASYSTFAFHAIRNVALVGTPGTTSDAGGYGTVTVKCTAPGDPQLTLSDTRNPPDNVDLVSASIGYGGKPRCVKT